MKKYQYYELDTFFIDSEVKASLSIFENSMEDMQIEVFSPKESIIHFHHAIDRLYFLLKGKAKIYMIHEDGKRSLIQFLKEGSFIGELTLLGIEKQPKDVIARNQCICLSMPLSTAREQLLTNNEFLLYLNRYLGNKLLRRTEFFAKNQNYELKNRLAAYILLTENNGIFSEKHTETAEFLGTSYRHLLYSLKKLEQEQVVTKQKQGYSINKEALHGLAGDI